MCIGVHESCFMNDYTGHQSACVSNWCTGRLASAPPAPPHPHPTHLMPFQLYLKGTDMLLMKLTILCFKINWYWQTDVILKVGVLMCFFIFWPSYNLLQQRINCPRYIHHATYIFPAVSLSTHLCHSQYTNICAYVWRECVQIKGRAEGARFISKSLH